MANGLPSWRATAHGSMNSRRAASKLVSHAQNPNFVLNSRRRGSPIPTLKLEFSCPETGRRLGLRNQTDDPLLRSGISPPTEDKKAPAEQKRHKDKIGRLKPKGRRKLNHVRIRKGQSGDEKLHDARVGHLFRADSRRSRSRPVRGPRHGVYPG